MIQEMHSLTPNARVSGLPQLISHLKAHVLSCRAQGLEGLTEPLITYLPGSNGNTGPLPVTSSSRTLRPMGKSWCSLYFHLSAQPSSAICHDGN